jgi:anaerobic selenocysteine-containing dehydrogenase
VDLFRDLAHRFHFEKIDPCFDQTVDEMIDLALGSESKWREGIDRRRLEAEGYVRLKLGDGPFLPFARGNFFTASGKAELYSESLAKQGLDPVVCFVPPAESRHSRQAQKFPLELLARKADNFLNTTFCNLPAHQAMEQTELLEIHEEDARARGISEGDKVRVFNDRGSVVLKAQVNGATQRGVVATRLNWAKLSPNAANINVLTSERLTDIGRGATFYSTLVDVERLSPASGNPGS